MQVGVGFSMTVCKSACNLVAHRCHCWRTRRFGQEVLVGYSEPISAADFADFESYVARIQQEWDAQWKRIYAADWSGVWCR